MGVSITTKSLFTGVSVLFNEAKLEQHMLHFKLWKRLLSRNISVRTVLQHTLLSLSPRLTRIVTKRYSLIGLQHPSSSSIHKQASVHARLFILQLQLRLQLDVVQRHVSSLMPDGTGGLVIRTEINLSLSNFHSFPSGEGTFLSDTRALLQTKAWKFARSIWWQRHTDVKEGPHSSDSSW